MLSLRRPNIRLTKWTMVFLITSAFLFFIFFWHLGSWTAGLSASESEAIKKSASLQGLIDSPANLPHNLFGYLLQKLDRDSIFSLRAVSAAFAVVFIACFYKIAKSWFGAFVAYLAALSLAATPLVLLAGRSATADIMFLAPLAVGASYFWMTRSKNTGRTSFIIFTATVALALYTPGTFWLLVAGLVAARGVLLRTLRSQPKWLVVVGGLVFLGLLSPLLWAGYSHFSSVKEVLLIPDTFAGALETLKSIAWMFLGVVWRSAEHNDLQIAERALLDAAQIILALFGSYAIWAKARSKTYGLAAMALLGITLAGISKNFSVLLFAIIPICILMAAGLRYLYIEWLGVFPRNPLPRALAVLLMSAVVVIHIFFGLRYSLIAWPHTVATRNTYVIKY